MQILESLDIVSEELYSIEKDFSSCGFDVPSHYCFIYASFLHMNSSFVLNKTRKLLLSISFNIYVCT